MEYYQDINSEEYPEILSKYEFSENHADNKIKSVYQEPHQLLLKNYISQNTLYDSMLMFHRVGVGKCHKKDTPILMYNGTIKMVQDISQGDLLMGDNSTPRTVLSLARGQDNMYDIIPTKGDKYTVNEEHILCLKASGFPTITCHQNNRNYNIQWIENNQFHSRSFKYNLKNQKQVEDQAYNFHKSIKTEQIIEISVKDYLSLSDSKKRILKGYRTGVKFTYKDTPIDPYMIGYWLGDGTARDSAITCQDSTVLHYFANKLGNYNLTLNHRKGGYTYGISGLTGKYNSNLFLTTLKSLDLINNKHIPDVYKCNSRENRLKLLAGIIDSDGYYSRGMFEITQSVKHENLIDDIIFLARSLGFACYKNKKKTSWGCNGIQNSGEAFRIIISGKGLDEIPTVIPRKKAEVRKQKKDVLVTGIKVKYVGRDNYYGFTLNGNSRYIMGDFTVTHNTCTSISIAEGFKEYLANTNRKVYVLVKNRNIQLNFINELQSQCTGEEYITNEERKLMNSPNYKDKKSLQQTIKKRIQKTYRILTYGTFRYKVEKEKSIKSLNNAVIIVDEAHNITNNQNYNVLHKVLSKSYNYRIVLLTATPIFDNAKEIAEIANLLNVNDQSKQLPIRNKLFKENFMLNKKSDYINANILKAGVTEITDKGKSALQKAFFGKVSFLTSNKSTNPEVIEKGEGVITSRVGSTKVILCKMSDYQYSVYNQAVNDDIKSNNIKPDMIEEDESGRQLISLDEDRIKGVNLYKNSNDASTMSYPSNMYGKLGFENVTKTNETEIFQTNLEMYSSKLYTLLQNVKNSPGNIFIYSNYTTAGGTSLVEKMLRVNGFTEYSGRKSTQPTFVVFDQKNPEQRDKLRKIFNSPENKNGDLIKIVIGSPVMSEGITLKNVRQVHILEPSWNMSRINQIIGRAVRNHSHDDLEQEQRNVEIYKYVSFYPSSEQTDFFIDKEKYILSEEKDRSNKKVERLLKQISFDCSLMKSRNIENSEKGSPECDYTNCDFECEMNPINTDVEKSTYNLYLNFIEKYTIDVITKKIKELFKEYYVWNISDIKNIIKTNDPQFSDEVIYSVLTRFVENKMEIVDQFSRTGFLLNKGPLYIFNPNDTDINTSLFSKILDFSSKTNKYTLSEYIQRTNIKDQLIEPTKEKKEKPKKDEEKEEFMTFEQEEYNAKLLKEYYDQFIQINNIDVSDPENIIIPDLRDSPLKQPILASYINKSKRIIDKTFRIISPRQQIITIEELKQHLAGESIVDARHLKTGMACGSFQKPILQIIAKNDLEILNPEIYDSDFTQEIHSDQELKSTSIMSLCKLFEKTFSKNALKRNLILHPLPPNF
jgi:superfamily II DNA or RNA helicase